MGRPATSLEQKQCSGCGKETEKKNIHFWALPDDKSKHGIGYYQFYRSGKSVKKFTLCVECSQRVLDFIIGELPRESE